MDRKRHYRIERNCSHKTNPIDCCRSIRSITQMQANVKQLCVVGDSYD